MSDGQRFRGALIGCGFFADNHMHAWASIDEAAIVALCDTDVNKARAMAKRFGIGATYDSVEALLAGETLDFVDIATTAPSHRPLVERAVREVATVICQKPFAERFADAAAMVEAAERAGATLLVHENFRWQKPFVELAERIDAGAVGSPHFARFSFRHGFDNYVNQPYLAEIERLSIMDVGLHLFDLARRFLGEVDTLSCRTQRLNPRVRGEDAFTALLSVTPGGTATVVATARSSPRSARSRSRARSHWIEGTDGTLALDAARHDRRARRRGRARVASDPEVPDWGERPGTSSRTASERFQAPRRRRDGRTREPGNPPAPTTSRTLTLALAAYEAAAESGRTVHIDALAGRVNPMSEQDPRRLPDRDRARPARRRREHGRRAVLGHLRAGAGRDRGAQGARRRAGRGGSSRSRRRPAESALAARCEGAGTTARSAARGSRCPGRWTTSARRCRTC